MRRRTLLGAAAAALAIGLTGCGIPDETDVRDVGAGPEAGEVRSSGAGNAPPAREEATTKEEFVSNFLAAVAGEPAKVEERYKSYLTESARGGQLNADAGVKIVRLRQPPTFTEVEEGSWHVEIAVDQLGVLDAKGSVSGGFGVRNYGFDIAVNGTEAGADNFVVTVRPEDDLLMSNAALERYFTPHTIYFWSLDRKTLVPDERYMPSEFDKGRQPTRIVDWLLGEPSDLIKQAVIPLNDVESKQNVPFPKDRLEVALSSEAAERKPGNAGEDVVTPLGQQLLWSLRQYVNADLELRIDGLGSQTFKKDPAFYAVNAANRAPVGPERAEAQPERFAIFEGKIHRLSGSPGGGTQSLPQLLLSGGLNQGVVSAALASEAGERGLVTAAALVVQDGAQRRLVTAVGDGAQKPEVKGSGSIGRAVWLKAPMDMGLVVVNGSLYQFTPGRDGLVRVDLEELNGKVLDVSAAPDGRRIAVVADGGVHLLATSRAEGGIQLKGTRPVPTSLSDVSAVDWSEETKLVVAGTGPAKKPEIWEVSLDGAIEKLQFDDPGGRVNHLVAYPDDPVAASAAIVMYARDGAAFDLKGTKPGIEASELMGVTGDVDPSQVTAPFFLLD